MKEPSFSRVAAVFCLIHGTAQGDAPYAAFFAGPDSGNLAMCLPYTQNVQRPPSFQVFPAGQQGGVRVAAGDVNGDGRADIIVGSGPGGIPQIKVLDGVSHQNLASFQLSGTGYAAGVWVASGDVNGDGRADIVTGAGGGAGVQVFSGATLQPLMSFNAYAPTFTGGVRVAAGDVNGDGTADIITGAGPGGSPHVKVFSGTNLSELASFFAYPTTYTGGVWVSAGRLNTDNKADIVVTPGPATAAMDLKIYYGPDQVTVKNVPLPSIPDDIVYSSVGGAASTGPQVVYFVQERKYWSHVADFDALQSIVGPDLDDPKTQARPFCAADVTGDAKPDLLLGHATLPVAQTITQDFAKRLFDKFPEGPTFRGGIRVAIGDLDADGTWDMIMGPGTGGSGMVKTCTGRDGSLIDNFAPFPLPAAFPINVAAGDVNGDGKADIISVPGMGGPSQVRVHESGTAALLKSFTAFSASFTGGINVGAGDIDADGIADIITSTGVGTASQVKAFSGKDLSVLHDFNPEAAGFSGGIFVAAGDLNGDGRADIVTGTGPGAQMVRAFDGRTRAPLAAFLPYETGFAGGVRVAVGDVTGDSIPEIVCSPGSGRAPEVRCFDFPSLRRVFAFQPYAATFTGGVFISSWTPPRASVIQSNVTRSSAGRMQLTLQAPKGRTLYLDSTANFLEWKQVESRPGTGAPVTFTADPLGASLFFVRGRVQ